ncbi:MAG: transcriptional regulator [Bacteroidales bacterium]|nr:transcriptional regulator [Bacteroidales bacterium]
MATDFDTENRWYALKVYFNRVQPLLREAEEMGLERFAPTGVVGNLLFLRCREEQALRFADRHWSHAWLYRESSSRRPAAIPDAEMEVFRFVVSAGRSGLTLLGSDKPEYHEGDRVVVTGGPFKGAEGHIRRIKRDRRLVVAVRGVVAVALAYIHPSLLRPVDE